MVFRQISEAVQFCWMFESQYQQRLAWEDAVKARISRDRAEAQAAAQLRAMLNANPAGSLGDAQINDPEHLKNSGLL